MPYMIRPYYPDQMDAVHVVTVHGPAYRRPGYVSITITCCGGIVLEVPETSVMETEPRLSTGEPVCRPCPWRNQTA